MMNAKLSESLAVVGLLPPQTVNSTPAYSGDVKVDKARHYLAVIFLGDMAAETIDVSILKSNTSSHGGETALKACTQLAAHASNNDNKVLLIDIRPEELALPSYNVGGVESNTFFWIRLKVVTGNTVGGMVCGVILAGDAKEFPASALNLASVVQVVT